MADNYEILDNPVYDGEIRKLKDSDPASATNTFNPLFQKIINNIHAVKLEMGTGGRWTQYLALSELELDDAAVAAAGTLDLIAEAMPDYSMISLTITEDLPWASLLPEREGTLSIIRCDGRQNTYLDFNNERNRYIRTYHEAAVKKTDWMMDRLNYSWGYLSDAQYAEGYYVCYIANDIFVRKSLMDSPLNSGFKIHLKGFMDEETGFIAVHNGFCFVLGDLNEIGIGVLETGEHNQGYYDFINLEDVLSNGDVSLSFTGFQKIHGSQNKCVVAGAGPTVAYATVTAGQRLITGEDFALCDTSGLYDSGKINQITFEHGYWVLCASNGIYYTRDLESGFTYLHLSASIHAIQYINGRWLMVDSDWKVRTSTDITTVDYQWGSFEISDVRPGEEPTFITYDNGFYIIGSTKGRIYYNDALSSKNWRYHDFGEDDKDEYEGEHGTTVFGFFREDDVVVVPVYCNREFYGKTPAIESFEPGGYNWRKIAASEDLGEAGDDYVPLNSSEGIRIGLDSVSKADIRWPGNSVAIGVGTRALSGVAIGDHAYSNASSLAIGLHASAAQYNSIAVGSYASMENSNGVVIGAQARGFGNHITAVGYQAKANVNGVAMGWNANAAYDSLALGRNANAFGGVSSAIGVNARASGTGGLAVGTSANANGTNAAAIGTSCTSNGFGSISIGHGGSATANYTMAIGRGTRANFQYATAIGGNSIAAGTSSTTLGWNARAFGNYSTAIGFNANIATSESNVIQLGNDNTSVLRCKAQLTTDSDIRDKTDIKPVESALAFLTKITPLQYVYNSRVLYIPDIDELDEENKQNLITYGMCDYDREAYEKGTKKGERKRIGVSAQEVISVLEEVYGSADEADIVNDNFHDLAERPEGVENKLTVNYSAFIPYLIGAVKELNARLEALEAEKNG